MSANIDPGSVNVEQYEKERKIKEQGERELSAPKMKELREASLAFFDNWRMKVMERVGMVVNSKETASSQLKTTPAPNPAFQSPDKAIRPEQNESRGISPDSVLTTLYPPIQTQLSSFEEPTRILIVHSVLLLLLSLEHYVAPSRVLLLYLTSSLHLPLSVLISDEEKVAKGLLEAAKQMSGETETQKKVEENKQSRKWKVGLASVAGAALIGVTGGLAAPLVAAGVGSVMGGLGLGATAAAGYLGSVAGSTLIVGGLFGAYGGKMTGQMMDAYAREVQDFAFLPVHGSHKEQNEKHQSGKRDNKPPTSFDQIDAAADRTAGQGHLSHTEEQAVPDPSSRRLRVTIGITGWLTSKTEILTPWHVLAPTSCEVFALRWELEALLNLGNSMIAMVSSAAWGYAKNEMIKRTIFAELMAAMWPVALLKVSRVVDNPFSVAKSRADKAGEVLADALINKAQGERPVSLIGYSLGARVIYTCLKNLARRHAFGLVESVVLIGAPAPSDTNDWRIMRSVVSSRLVNVYSENDYVLGFLYRTSSIQYGVAGLQKIEGLSGVENVDVSEVVSGHLRYRYLTGHILQRIGFEGVSAEQVEKEENALRKMDEEEEEKRNRATKTENKEGNEEEEAAKMEKDVQEKTDKGLVSGAMSYVPKRLKRGESHYGDEKSRAEETKAMLEKDKESEIERKKTELPMR